MSSVCRLWRAGLTVVRDTRRRARSTVTAPNNVLYTVNKYNNARNFGRGLILARTFKNSYINIFK